MQLTKQVCSIKIDSLKKRVAHIHAYQWNAVLMRSGRTEAVVAAGAEAVQVRPAAAPVHSAHLNLIEGKCYFSVTTCVPNSSPR